MERVDISIAFRIGELTLFERRLTGLADRRHFSEQEVAAEVPELPQVLNPQVGFYFFPTYPVQRPPASEIRRDGWIYYTPYSFRNYYVDFRRLGTFDAYLSSFSGKSRSTLRRKVKRFAEADGGSVDWRLYGEPREMPDFLRLALPLSAKTYQERLLSSGLPRGADFESRLGRRAESKGVLGFILFFRNRPVAYSLCFVNRRIATYDYVGYDPDVQELSPGTVLQYFMIEAMFAKGDIDIFDFTEGEGAQKEFFSTDYRQCAKTYVLRDTISNRATVWMHGSLNSLSSWVGAVLDRLAIKNKLRKVIRRWA